MNPYTIFIFLYAIFTPFSCENIILYKKLCEILMCLKFGKSFKIAIKTVFLPDHTGLPGRHNKKINYTVLTSQNSLYFLHFFNIIHHNKSLLRHPYAIFYAYN